MACNCGTKEEIDKLYRLYGEKLGKPNENDNAFIFWFKKITYFIVSIILYTIAIPMMFIYVLAVFFWEENPRININSINLLHLFKIKK